MISRLTPLSKPASYTLEITLPPKYPSQARPSVYLSCGDQVSTTDRKRARAALAEIAREQDPPGDEVLDLIINGFRDLLPSLTNTTNASTNDAPSSPHDAAGATHPSPPVKQVVIWSHHLLATSKRRSIQTWSKELHLSGFARPGYPGAVFAEGEEDQVDEFVRRLKALRWQALQVRAEDIVESRVCGDGSDGVVECETLSEIAEMLKGKGDGEVGKMFLEGMKIAGGAGH